MHLKRLIILNTLIIALPALIYGCSPNKPAVIYPYDSKEPLKEARVFGAGSISMPNSWEGTAAISPDGNEVIFQSIREESKRHYVLLYRSRFQNGIWSKAELLPFMDPNAVEADPALSPDGQTLFFTSDRPALGLQGLNIWQVTRKANGEWGEPKVLGPEINKTNEQLNPTAAANGNLYFSRGPYFYRSILKDGSYQEAEVISDNIKLKGRTYISYIDPKERFLLYFSDPTGGRQYDIWVSYNRNGQWTEGERLNEKVNTGKMETAPTVSPDGKYLFFSRFEESDVKISDILQIDLAETGIKLK